MPIRLAFKVLGASNHFFDANNVSWKTRVYQNSTRKSYSWTFARFDNDCDMIRLPSGLTTFLTFDRASLQLAKVKYGGPGRTSFHINQTGVLTAEGAKLTPGVHSSTATP